ncbi:MAG: hypothetical protein AAB327_03525 [Actinomycetota bacterium]
MQISKGRIDRLGNSIRDGTLSAEDVEILHEMRSRWDIADFQLRLELLNIFEQTEFEVTSRIKNMGTLREKLLRTNLRLSEIRDVVGCRVVVGGGLELQDGVVERICRVIGDRNSKIIDRRKSSNNGYRAVHVEVRIGEIICEIQVRTTIQDLWATTNEILAETVGRGIRYGELPKVTGHPALVQQTLRDLHRELQELSGVIAMSEEQSLPGMGNIESVLMNYKVLVNEIRRGIG